MNTRASRIILLLVILAVIAVVVFVVKDKETSDVSNTQPTSGITLDSLNSSTVLVPELDVEVTLSQGQGEFTVLDTPVIGYVAMGKSIVTDSSLAISTLAVNAGGTGIFEYLALFKQGTSGIDHTSSIFIGDRIEVKSIEFVKSNGKVVGAKVSYLDRSPDDSMADEPTIPRTLEVSIKDSKFTN